jgi:uncharacterized Fe-S radical SAM superfamily protein PflX
LAKIMVYLQELGCHNMNFVTPNPFRAPDSRGPGDS